MIIGYFILAVIVWMTARWMFHRWMSADTEAWAEAERLHIEARTVEGLPALRALLERVDVAITARRYGNDRWVVRYLLNTKEFVLVRIAKLYLQ